MHTQRLADRGRERCTLDMIWAEYEAFLRQEPLLPCRYSRPVLHKVSEQEGRRAAAKEMDHPPTPA